MSKSHTVLAYRPYRSECWCNLWINNNIHCHRNAALSCVIRGECKCKCTRDSSINGRSPCTSNAVSRRCWQSRSHTVLEYRPYRSECWCNLWINNNIHCHRNAALSCVIRGECKCKCTRDSSINGRSPCTSNAVSRRCWQSRSHTVLEYRPYRSECWCNLWINNNIHCHRNAALSCVIRGECKCKCTRDSSINGRSPCTSNAVSRRCWQSRSHTVLEYRPYRSECWCNLWINNNIHCHRNAALSCVIRGECKCKCTRDSSINGRSPCTSNAVSRSCWQSRSHTVLAYRPYRSECWCNLWINNNIHCHRNAALSCVIRGE